MTDPERNKILERVRKMMRLASNTGASEGERDNALRMARATLAKYNLDMAEIEAGGSQAGEKRILHDGRFYGRPWARNIAHSIADLCFCSYLFVPGRLATDTRHIFVGRTSNAITAAELAQYVVESVSREGRRHQKTNYLNNEAYRAFGWGAASSIRRRIDALIASGAEAMRETTETRTTNEADASKALMVLATNEEQANKDLIEEMIGKPRKTASRAKGFSDDSSASAGSRFGETVSLDRQISGSSRRRLT